jgi:hypothetical protein
MLHKARYGSGLGKFVIGRKGKVADRAAIRLASIIGSAGPDRVPLWRLPRLERQGRLDQPFHVELAIPKAILSPKGCY